MEDLKKQFEHTLSKIIRSDPAIKKVILVDRTGLTIAHANPKNVGQFPDPDGIGAIASAVFGASEEQGVSLRIGDLDLVTSEFEKGKIFASSCGKAVLCLITDASIGNIGMIRLIMKKASEELYEPLDQFFSAATSASDFGGLQELAPKSSLGLEKDELEAALRELEKF